MRDTIVHLVDLDKEFCRQVEQAIQGTSLQTGSLKPTADSSIRWAVATSYGETLRGMLLDEPDAAAFEAGELVDAARHVSGRDEVALFRIQANAMVPGQGLGRHTDIPEFRGARRWAFPDWLLVTMLHAGLFNDLRIKVVSALVWPIETNGGRLRVFDRHDRSLLASFEPVPGTAVVFDTCRLPHEVGTVPGDEVATGDGAEAGLTGGRWQLRRADGSTRSLRRDEVRASVLLKFGCFVDAAERDQWFAGIEEALDRPEVIARLVAGLPSPVGGGDLRQVLADHYVSYL